MIFPRTNSGWRMALLMALKWEVKKQRSKWKRLVLGFHPFRPPIAEVHALGCKSGRSRSFKVNVQVWFGNWWHLLINYVSCSVFWLPLQFLQELAFTCGRHLANCSSSRSTNIFTRNDAPKPKPIVKFHGKLMPFHMTAKRCRKLPAVHFLANRLGACWVGP